MNAEQLKERTYQFALSIVLMSRSLKILPETDVLRKQVIRSSTSVSLNYSAACQARSKKEWFAKICIVAEEADETLLLLRFLKDLELVHELEVLGKLSTEALELVKIFSKIKSSYKSNQVQEPVSIYSSLNK